ncbi:MAG: hypothetical protein Q7Q71_09770 [Verrucomicrobiota bacterium JB023]|nr:hypothetical protein [Verrucomicrobiota bacterium JB023]
MKTVSVIFFYMLSFGLFGEKISPNALFPEDSSGETFTKVHFRHDGLVVVGSAMPVSCSVALKHLNKKLSRRKGFQIFYSASSFPEIEVDLQKRDNFRQSLITLIFEKRGEFFFFPNTSDFTKVGYFRMVLSKNKDGLVFAEKPETEKGQGDGVSKSVNCESNRF